MDRFRARHLGQARHGHDVAADGDDEAGAGSQPPFGVGRRTSPLPSIFASHQRTVRGGIAPTRTEIASVETGKPPRWRASLTIILNTRSSKGEVGQSGANISQPSSSSPEWSERAMQTHTPRATVSRRGHRRRYARERAGRPCGYEPHWPPSGEFVRRLAITSFPDQVILTQALRGLLYSRDR